MDFASISKLLQSDAKKYQAKEAIDSLAAKGNLVKEIDAAVAKARLNSEYTLDGDLRATGNVAAGATIETSMTAFGNVLGNIYATAVAAISMSADLKGRGNMEANIDWAARPSAFDIAQEVMNFTLDGFTYQDIVKLQAAILLGKVSGGGSATETFRDISDTKDRVVATVDASGNRTAITLDAD